MQRAWPVRLMLLALVVGASLGTAADHVPYYWQDLDVAIDVQENGDVLVTETQTYVFTGPHTPERLRWIPLTHHDTIHDVQVFEDGQALPTQTGVDTDRFWIRWRHAPKALETRTFVVRYRAKGAVYIDPRNDQVIWPALFESRDAPIERGSVTVRVPPALAGHIQHSTSYGVSAEVQQIDARTVTFVPQRALQPDESLTVKLYVPHGVLNAPTPDWQQGLQASYTLPGLLGTIDTWVFVIGGVVAIAWTLTLAAQKHRWDMTLSEDARTSGKPAGRFRRMPLIPGGIGSGSSGARGIGRTGGTGGRL